MQLPASYPPGHFPPYFPLSHTLYCLLLPIPLHWLLLLSKCWEDPTAQSLALCFSFLTFATDDFIQSPSLNYLVSLHGQPQSSQEALYIRLPTPHLYLDG